MNDLIDRQAAIDAVEFGITFAKVIDKSTGEVKELFREGNDSLTAAIKRIKNLPSVEAIPVEWIERKIARLKEMDNAFASLTASQLQALLNDWRTEQNEG